MARGRLRGRLGHGAHAALLCAATAWISFAALAPRVSARVAQGAAPGPVRMVWDGVYTERQARRGEAAFAQSCASCHAEDLRGRSTAPSLVEESFAFLWGDLTVGELFSRTKATMPSDRPGSLPAETYADLVAFLLQKNGYPAGSTELAALADALESIRISTTRPPGK